MNSLQAILHCVLNSDIVICIIGLSGWLYSVHHPIPQGFSSLLLKPYIKLLTHSEKVGWWKTLMVECVIYSVIFYTISLHRGTSFGCTDIK